MSNFIQADRNQRYLLPPDLRDWIPDDDMVHFVIEACEQVNLRHFRYNTRGSGSAQYHPQMMLALLVYSYANGIFSSRRIERATYRDIGVRFLTADTHPDHDTICKFRRENEAAIKAAFVHVLLLAKELGLVKLGNVSIDGTKLKANASKSRSIRYDRAGELSKQLASDIDELLEQAKRADDDDDDDDHLPSELARRGKLKEKLDAAREELEQRAKDESVAQQDDYERKVEAREQRTGSSKGRIIKPLETMPKPTNQINLTDADSALMRKNKRSGYEQSYNAQATVDADGSQLIVGCHVSNNASDRNELVKGIESIPVALGKPQGVLADNGYASGDQVESLQRQELKVLVATGKEGGQRKYDFRPATPVKPPPEIHKKWIKKMNEEMAKPDNRALYRRRQQTVEPVFGIIKAVLGFTHFRLRGIERVGIEWQLIALAYNCKRVHRLCC